MFGLFKPDFGVMRRLLRQGASILGAASLLAASSWLRAEQRSILGVCTAIHGVGREVVTVRGIGRAVEGGFTLFDHTCPVVVDTTSLPAAILLDLTEISPARSLLKELVLTHSRELYQVVVRGRITCVEDFRVDRTTGNGFDPMGRSLCKLAVSHVLQVERWW
jgi:hypothetical protein